jgi:hypothetical protein
MKEILLPLTGIMFCAATIQSAAKTTLLLHVKQDEGWHAAVTDIPDVIDMSHADPRTWHRLPQAAGVNNLEGEDWDQPRGFSFEAAMTMIGSSRRLASNIAKTPGVR